MEESTSYRSIVVAPRGLPDDAVADVRATLRLARTITLEECGGTDAAVVAVVFEQLCFRTGVTDGLFEH